MARFAQYYIKYHYEFAPYDWEKRQEHLGALFEKDESITFGVGEPSEEQKAKGEQYAKTYNHRVYHLQNNPSIIVMQFANSIDIPVEKNFGPDFAKDEPSCFVIIDNRDNLRTVAIQKRKKAFGNPGQVAMKSIEGSKPMQIVWHLNTPMSEATYAFASQYKAIG